MLAWLTAFALTMALLMRWGVPPLTQLLQRQYAFDLVPYYPLLLGFVALTMPGHWVLGGLATQVWSFAGEDARADVSQFLFQYFINYNFKDGWYATSAPIITADWEASSSQRWTVPFGGGFGKIMRFGKQPVNLSLHAYYNLERPDVLGDWSARLQIQFLFPKKR